MELNSSIAYLTAIVNGYERQINKGYKTVGSKETFLKEVVGNLGDLLDFMSDKKTIESKSTLQLNAEVTENARAYKSTLAMKESVITSLKVDLKDMQIDLHKNGYIEQENIRLKADNLKLKSKLAMASVSGRTIRELKADNQLWAVVCTEQKEKLDLLKNTTCTWAILYKELLNDYKKATKSNWDENL